jgi:hypothetical protein
MKERPILFSAPMVRAILEGRKTQTRRIIKRPLKHPGWTEYVYYGPSPNNPTCVPRAIECGPDYPDDDSDAVLCPYGSPGDRLWVRETWALNPIRDFGIMKPRSPADCIYRAGYGTTPSVQWTPSIHMPRVASRITLEVTGVRVERLQEISNADARAEGIVQTWGDFGGKPPQWAWDIYHLNGNAAGPHQYDNKSSSQNFQFLWESINGIESWAANPWVWVVSFSRVQT